MEEDLMKASKILLFTVAVLLISLNAFAAVEGSGVPGDNPPRHHPGMHDPNLLNLTPDQQSKLKEIWGSFRKDTVFLRNDLKIKRLELQTLWTVPQPEKDKIVAKQKEIIDLTTQLKMKAIDARLEARKVLTPEQAAQVGMWGPEMRHKGHRPHRM
jgi:Spy/CpxP family protein refolding chaperone